MTFRRAILELMDAEHETALPKIRTFARDQAHVQHHDEPAVIVPAVVADKEVVPEAVEVKKPVIVPAAHITVPEKKASVSTPPAAHIPAFHELKKKSVTEPLISNMIFLFK